jgi:uncharacterized protein (TIGR00369 family)
MSENRSRDDDAPDEWLMGDGRCFGCGPANEHGLRLRFRRVGPGEVEGEYTAPEHQAGAPGVVHGGIQAALLDETLGFAAHAAREPGADDIDIVTVEFSLRYRRPAPTGQPLRLRGRLVRREGRDLWMTGGIEDVEGRVLTEAEARWRRLR